MPAYGFAHLIDDLVSGEISEGTIHEKLRQAGRQDRLPEDDIRHLIRQHFAAESNVEALLLDLHPSVLELTGLNALLETIEHSRSLETAQAVDG